jgi:hypothetical protein
LAASSARARYSLAFDTRLPRLLPRANLQTAIPGSVKLPTAKLGRRRRRDELPRHFWPGLSSAAGSRSRPGNKAQIAVAMLTRPATITALNTISIATAGPCRAASTRGAKNTDTTRNVASPTRVSTWGGRECLRLTWNACGSTSDTRRSACSLLSRSRTATRKQTSWAWLRRGRGWPTWRAKTLSAILSTKRRSEAEARPTRAARALH